MKNLLRYLAFVLMVGGACAQSNLPPCQGSDKTEWRNCIGTFQIANGDKYVGEVKDGKRNGQGTATFVDGNKYVGEFKDDRYNGQGTYTFANGDKFVGEFRAGKENGQGTYTYADGEKYVGKWKDGNENGQGTYTFANGNKYVGEWKDGNKNGQGTFTHAKGEVYVGEYKNGKKDGQGTYTFANGRKYVGEWKDDKANGQGTLYSSNGSIINQGIWSDDTFVRSATLQQITVPSLQQSNTPNTGLEKQSNLPLCQGSVFTWNNCSATTVHSDTYRYVGEFKMGKPSGQGTEVDTGRKYVGEFSNGRRNGLGTLFSPDGSVINQGLWANGVFVRSSPIPLLQPSQPIQQTTTLITEIEKLRAEAELERKRRQELEEQLRLSQQQTQTTSPTVSVPSIGRRVALVVGNANYKVRPLKNPRNDADDISRSLRSSGFEVIDLRDASLQQMRNGVRQFGDRLINNDVGLVYFSGHGVEVKGRNYFIPVNADIMREDEIADQGLDVSLILEKMNTAGKGVNILIVDACRDDPFGRSFRSSSRGLAQMDAPRGTIIAYATSPGKVASDGDPRERNSPYTKNLIKAMQQPNKPIEQVFKEVRRAVQEETKNQQTPWENTSLSGDFFFRVQK